MARSSSEKNLPVNFKCVFAPVTSAHAGIKLHEIVPLHENAHPLLNYLLAPKPPTQITINPKA